MHAGTERSKGLTEMDSLMYFAEDQDTEINPHIQRGSRSISLRWRCPQPVLAAWVHQPKPGQAPGRFCFNFCSLPAGAFMPHNCMCLNCSKEKVCRQPQATSSEYDHKTSGPKEALVHSQTACSDQEIRILGQRKPISI